MPPCDGHVCVISSSCARAFAPYGYADATACDKLVRLRSWFDALLEQGPAYGYYPKPAKCILVVKPDFLTLAKKLFRGSGVQLQSEGSKDTGGDKC